MVIFTSVSDLDLGPEQAPGARLSRRVRTGTARPAGVTFTLTPNGDGTRLTVTESGFAALPAEVREQRYEENTQGWDGGLPELVTFAERAA